MFISEILFYDAPLPTTGSIFVPNFTHFSRTEAMIRDFGNVLAQEKIFVLCIQSTNNSWWPNNPANVKFFFWKILLRPRQSHYLDQLYSSEFVFAICINAVDSRYCTNLLWFFAIGCLLHAFLYYVSYLSTRNISSPQLVVDRARCYKLLFQRGCEMLFMHLLHLYLFLSTFASSFIRLPSHISHFIEEGTKPQEIRFSNAL